MAGNEGINGTNETNIKHNKMLDLNPISSIIILTINDLNMAVKRQSLSDFM